ncbi:Uncharacterised protein [Candidatus Bartonella washoeensis]|nr:Uncharacterised protein [Bartonella washoeensis]
MARASDSIGANRVWMALSCHALRKAMESPSPRVTVMSLFVECFGNSGKRA